MSLSLSTRSVLLVVIALLCTLALLVGLLLVVTTSTVSVQIADVRIPHARNTHKKENDR